MKSEFSKLLHDIISILGDLKINYFIFDALAADVWGQPRFTNNIDLIISTKDPQFASLIANLKKEGFEIETRKGIERLKKFRMLKLSRGLLGIDLVLGDTKFDHSAFKRKRVQKIFEIETNMASAEDTILYKLISGRNIDLFDIENIVIRQGKTLDLSYLRKWSHWLSEQTGLTRIKEDLDRILVEYGSF